VEIFVFAVKVVENVGLAGRALAARFSVSPPGPTEMSIGVCDGPFREVGVMFHDWRDDIFWFSAKGLQGALYFGVEGDGGENGQGNGG